MREFLLARLGEHFHQGSLHFLGHGPTVMTVSKPFIQLFAYFGGGFHHFRLLGDPWNHVFGYFYPFPVKQSWHPDLACLAKTA
jgi:hypothetical protein